ncbi:Eco57I restriction-modification methylase domain-containing protein [Rhodococcoides fascians]|uniref:Eco57I restriction-modification methylase domain-containing protein n=1 Tax=Rhodococcoides fascians TaxID=1828 RepID=UPI00050BFBC6|nr:hypothetical protein [Rhodococcus fascians]
MFESIANVNYYLSEHWLAEVFPNKLKDLAKTWKERAAQGKDTPIKGFMSVGSRYLNALADVPDSESAGFSEAVTESHRLLLTAMGFETSENLVETSQGETPITVPLLGRFVSPTATDALHILQAAPVENADALFGDEAQLLHPIELKITSEKTEFIKSVSKAVTQLFITDGGPRYLLLVAGSVVLLTDAARWSEGRYLAFDVAAALDRRDDKATGELAHHAGLWSADVLLPNDDGKTALDAFTEDSEKHAIGVSEDLREGLRLSIEKIANEVLGQRREADLPVEGISELPRDLTIQSLRFLYRILFLLFAEARPELGILPVGAPEYGSGYGLDRLREIIGVPLTGRSARGHHLHESLNLLFRLVNDGHNAGGEDSEGLVFEAMRSDLFDPHRTPLIDDAKLSNGVLQEVLTLLLMSKPSKNKTKQRGYISYAQLGINQLGAVYEGLMSYSGLIATDEMVEVAKDGNADKGSWLVASTKSADYDADDLVWREDRLTGRKDIVRHPEGSFVFRLSGRDRQRSASYYTPEVLTKTVVKHALAELITERTRASEILEYRICEPALGSGAFLNEAINQLASEYLTRRQNELGERIEPEAYATEIQRVKAYIALHRAYGVDLNATAIELAEVSLWLNVMHEGLQAPWFGLHLRRGNSLIGARRATYDFTSLGRAKKSWLKTPPTERPLSEGGIGEGEIHHFLLPADGWGAVGGAKQAKELAPEEATALRKWRAEVTKKPTAKQLERLRALSRRVERLWELTLRRLEISEREVSRQISVWGAEIESETAAVTREQVESELLNPEGPYMRLRLAMDAWCALWFWPLFGALDGNDDNNPRPPDLDEWATTLEGLLGADGLKKGAAGQGMFHETINRFEQLSEVDDLERSFYGMQDVWRLVSKHEWLGTARSIAEVEGFFHWELDFAQIFQLGGFDLQVGNPPWVQPAWKDDITLSEHDPYFSLQENIPSKIFETRRRGLLSNNSIQIQYINDLTSWAGTANYLGSPTEFPILEGLKTNLYTNFITRVWLGSKIDGVIGMIHPESHFGDPKAGKLRAEVYLRLRRHWQFVNELMLFEDIGHPVTYGIHIYSAPSPISFMQISSLLHPDTANGSLDMPAGGDVPGIQYQWGGWDLRPHSSRVCIIDDSILRDWSLLFDPVGTPSSHARLLRPLTREHLEILSVLARQKVRISEVGYRWTLCFDEAKAKKDGIIEWHTDFPKSWSDAVIQGPHLTVGNPFSKQPNELCRSKGDYSPWDLEALPPNVIPRTNYQISSSRSDYEAYMPRWLGRPVVDYWRFAWRAMTQPGLERSLHCALIVPGTAHIHGLFSATVLVEEIDHQDTSVSAETAALRSTALIAGMLASLPFDYLVKVSGKANVSSELVERFPAPLNHPAWPFLLLRILRLNCLIAEYAPLWSGAYDSAFLDDSWTPAFPGLAGLGGVTANWGVGTPLRGEFERRAALVEIDALVALMLGISADHLCIMFRTQFPVLRKYEYAMYFDGNGRKITKDHQSNGVKQQKDDYKLLQAYLDGEDHGDLLDRYEPYPSDGTRDEPHFFKPDREVEMRTAYAEFARRLDLNG